MIIRNILGEFNLKPLAISVLSIENKDDLINIEPYQISCLYGADRLSINFIYTLENLHTKEYLGLKTLLSNLGLFSYKLKYLRIIHNLTNYKKTRKNKLRMKMLQYLMKYDKNFGRINLFK